MSRADDLARRRQAIFYGLSQTLGADHAQIGVRIWDASYAKQRPSAIIDYVTEVASTLELPPNQRHEMRMALYQALLKYDAGRETPPPMAVAAPAPVAAGAEGAPVAAKVVALPPAAEFVVFSCIAQEIFDGVRDAGGVAQHEFRQSLQNQNGHSGLSALERKQLIDWSKSGSPAADLGKTAEKTLARMVHVLYFAACEALGPVRGDRLRAVAGAAAAALPVSRRYSPRKLL
jgi:hypothetical protein